MKSICILGVDGTGKSTVISKLSNYFGDSAVVQYMGLKNWETKIARFFYSNCSNNSIILWLRQLVHILELYHRVYKWKKSDKIVIFDRYAYEQVLQYNKRRVSIKGKIMRTIMSIAYGKFFYKPTYTIYLKCDPDVSIKRKDDITTQEEIENFMKNKKIMDEYYTKQSDVVVLDTTSVSIDDTVGNILNIVGKI